VEAELASGRHSQTGFRTGPIIEAVDNQPWSGEANVHVSIANWVETQDAALLPKTRKLWFKVEPAAARKLRKRGTGPASKEYELDFRECDQINSALSDMRDVSAAAILRANQGYSYTGQYPRHEGFMLDEAEAREILRRDPKNAEVVLPFLVGSEFLTGGGPERWVIDFQTRGIFDAKNYQLPFAHLQRKTLPYITAKAENEQRKTGKYTGQDQNWLKTWWLHFRARPELIGKVSKLKRFIVCSRVTKRPVFVFVSPLIRPGDALSCFALEDDYSFGILQFSAHWLWFITKCSKFKSDFRYTPESVFDTFPWPQFEAGSSRREEAKASPATVAKTTAVATAAREVRRVRAQTLPKLKGGLRALYRTLEPPGANPLKDAHAALDAAVLAAYGFSAKKDLLAQLLELNLSVAKRLEETEPVTPPGIPAAFPNPQTLVSDDCIRPQALA
jgi:hypothetical protein